MEPMTAMLLVSAASAALSGITGGLGASKAKKEQRRARRAALSAAQRNQQLTHEFGLKEQNELMKGLEAALGGFDTARGEVGRTGRASKRRAVESGEQLQSQIAQTLQNTGFGSNSSLAANAARGIRADTQRALAGVDEGLGRMFSDLAVGRGQAEMSGRSQIAGSIANQGNELRNINRDIAAAFGARSFSGQTPGVDLSGLAGLLAMLGGGGGAAGGTAGATGTPPPAGMNLQTFV